MESPPPLAEIEAKNTRDFGSRIPFSITEPIKVPDKFDDQGAPTLDLGNAKEVE